MNQSPLSDFVTAAASMTVEEHEPLLRCALFDLASTIRRADSLALCYGEIKVAVRVMVDALIQRSGTDEMSAEFVISVMATIQGICPEAAWSNWYRLTAG